MAKFISGDINRLAHTVCVEGFNSTIACGADHGDCRSADCALSESYVGPPVDADARRSAIARLNEYDALHAVAS